MLKFSCVKLLSIGVVQVAERLLNLNSPNQFTLTCISTGGPATTVMWTRDSVYIAEGTNNRTTAQYTHTLTVTGTQEGIYECSVSNAFFNASAIFNVTGENIWHTCTTKVTLL